VGMCQVGAAEMARRGSSFQEIPAPLFSGDRDRARGSRARGAVNPRSAMIARPATPADSGAIAKIYNQGIEDRIASSRLDRARTPTSRNGLTGDIPMVVVEA